MLGKIGGNRGKHASGYDGMPYNLRTGDTDRYRPVSLGAVYDAREYLLLRSRTGYPAYNGEKHKEHETRNRRWKDDALRLAEIADRMIRDAEMHGISEWPWDGWKRNE
jgi:hypothetical protein